MDWVVGVLLCVWWELCCLELVGGEYFHQLYECEECDGFDEVCVDVGCVGGVDECGVVVGVECDDWDVGGGLVLFERLDDV